MNSIELDFDKKSGTVTGLKDKYKSVSKLVIPNKIEGVEVIVIGCSAFEKNYSLERVVIPKSVKVIEWLAFRNCTSLTSITIPNSVVAIGGWAFHNCINLISVNIPNNVTTIERFTFFGCVALTSVTIPNNVTAIGNHAFYNCKSLANVTIPNRVKSIREYAFYGCDELTVKIVQTDLDKITLEKDYWERGMQFRGIKGIIVPSSNLDTYKEHGDWGKYEDIMTGY